MKYMGSKSRIAKYIVPIIQEYIDKNNIQTYWEPFVGGANIIDKVKCPRRIGSDKNPYLIALLQRVQSGGWLYPDVSRELYNEARQAYQNNDLSKFTDWQLGNIGFLASYNGKWFDGGYAKPVYEKTKHGERYRDYYREAKQNLMNQADNLQGIKFYSLDYRKASIPHDEKWVIYADPPYQNTTGFSNAKDFDYYEFWNIIRMWSQYHIVLVSEQSAPDDFIPIWEQKISRSLSANNKKFVTEKLYIYRSGIA